MKRSDWYGGISEALEHDPASLTEDVILAVTEQVSAIMQVRGLKQRDLARLLKVSESAVSQFLSGDQNVSIRRLVQIALALGMKLLPPRLVPFGDESTAERERDYCPPVHVK